jgi:hypothetical protein
MPKLKIAFILRNALNTNKPIKKVKLFIPKSKKRSIKLFTAFKNGEMVIRKLSKANMMYIPTLYLIPSITKSVGEVKIMEIINNSLAFAIVLIDFTSIISY